MEKILICLFTKRRSLEFLRNDCKAYGRKQKPTKNMQGEIQGTRTKCLGWISVPKKDCAYTLSIHPSELKYFPSLPNTLAIISLLRRIPDPVVIKNQEY
jgi:hypothetical protein